MLVGTVHTFLDDIFRHMFEGRLQKLYRRIFKWLKLFKQLLMKFQRDVSAAQSRDAWSRGFEKTSTEYPNIGDRIPQLMAAMSDMKKGEEMIYSFTDDEVEIFARGESKAVIKGHDFIEALFTVRLKYPPNKEFSRGLLGK